MDFDKIIRWIPEINSGSFIKLPQNLQNRTEFVGMGRFTSSTNPIATWGIGPCLGIGISGGGVNFLEHASPHGYERGGSAISHMEQVILKFREYGQTPNVYLFRTGLDPEISDVIYKLNYLGLIESGNVFFCNLSGINIYNKTSYVGIYNNKPFYFQKRIQNPSYNNSKNYLNFNFTNTNIQKAKQFSVGDYVMIRDLPYTYVITYIASNGSKITLYNLSKPNSPYTVANVGPDRIVKKRSYSNTVRGRTTYPITDHIQKQIDFLKNK
jgi:hypothetical protein